MAFLKLTYYNGFAECCSECLLEPCQCCCYNETNGSNFDSFTAANLSGPCTNGLLDWPSFDAYDCSGDVPTSSTCAMLEDQAEFDAYSCVGTLVNTSVNLTAGSALTVFNGNDSFTNLEFNYARISCWPTTSVRAVIDHTNTTGGDPQTTNVNLGLSANSHFNSGSTTWCYNTGGGCLARKVTRIQLEIVTNAMPGGETLPFKFCAEIV